LQAGGDKNGMTMNCSIASPSFSKVQAALGQNAGCAATGTNDIPVINHLKYFSGISVHNWHGYTPSINLKIIAW
jgi:hypothetical protein